MSLTKESLVFARLFRFEQCAYSEAFHSIWVQGNATAFT